MPSPQATHELWSSLGTSPAPQVPQADAEAAYESAASQAVHCVDPGDDTLPAGHETHETPSKNSPATHAGVHEPAGCSRNPTGHASHPLRSDVGINPSPQVPHSDADAA